MAEGQNKPEQYFGQNSIKPQFSDALDSLQAAEDSAALPQQQTTESSSNLEQTRQADAATAQRSLYTGSGRPNTKSKRGRGALNVAKKHGAVAFLIVILSLAGIGIFGASSFLGSHLDALVTQITDTQYTTMTLRERALTRQMLRGELEPTNHLRSRFGKYNLELSDGSGGRTITYKNQVITADNFDSTFESNPEFRDSISDATHGRAANYFDDSSDQYFKDMYQTRDLQQNYRQTGNRDTDDANYNQLMSNHHAGDADANINTAHDVPQFDEETGEPILDENGEQVVVRELTGEDVAGASIDAETPTAKAQSYLLGASRKVASAGGIMCAVLKVGNLVSVAVAAKDMYNAINYFMSQSEPQSKVKVGEGDSSGIHTWLEHLYTSDTNVVKDPTTGEDVELTGAPLDDDGMRAINGDLTPRHANVKYFSMERGFVATMTALATNGISRAVCGGSILAGAIISVSTIASGGFIKMSIGMLLDTILTTAIAIAVSSAVMAILGNVLIPIIADTLFSNPYDKATGIQGGSLYVRGSMLANSAFLGRTTTAQTPSAEEAVLAFNHATDVILAQDAEIERLRSNPFDASSPNTFLGSIVSKLIPLTTNSNALSTLSTISSVTGASLARLSPVHADSIGDAFLSTFGQNCDVANSIGAVGDPYCGVRVTSDLSVINLPLDDPTYRSVIDPNLEYDENGNEIIKEGSPLAEFIRYALMRKSPFGVPDAGIAAECQTDFGVFGKIPFIGDILQAINAVEESVCMDVATGAKYVNSPDNEYWQTEGKYYQLYVATTRALDQFGTYQEVGTVNPVLAYQAKYRAEHPLDTSPAGSLAAISGLSKDDAELVLALAEYGDVIANYDPTERFEFSNKSRQHNIFRGVRNYGKSEVTSPIAFITHPQIDLRNRSYAA